MVLKIDLRKIISCILLFFLSSFCIGQGPNTSHLTSRQETDSIYLSLKQQLEEAKKNGSSPAVISKYLLQLGTFYQQANLFTEALDQYNQALELLDTQGREVIFVQLNNSIGQIYLELNNFEKAKGYFEEAMNAAITLDYKRGEAQAKGLLGTCYEKTEGYPEALRLQKESLALFEALKDSSGISLVQENIGSIYEDQLDLQMAEVYFIRAYEYLENRQSPLAANILNNLGDVNRKSNH